MCLYARPHQPILVQIVHNICKIAKWHTKKKSRLQLTQHMWSLGFLEFLVAVDQSKGLMGNHSKSATEKSKIFFARGNSAPTFQKLCYNWWLPIMPEEPSPECMLRVGVRITSRGLSLVMQRLQQLTFKHRNYSMLCKWKCSNMQFTLTVLIMWAFIYLFVYIQSPFYQVLAWLCHPDFP